MRLPHILGLAMAVLLGACGSEPTGPGAIGQPMAHATADAEVVAATPILSADECVVPDPPPGTIPWANTAPPLERYCAAFWVVQGEDQVVSMAFADSADAKSRWFLRLFIPAYATFVDDTGSPLSDGSVVRVTVAVHPTLYAVRFGPHGSGFGGARPAVLKLNYSWADLGKKDAKDLIIYYQSEEEGLWEAQLTSVDNKGNFVSTWLYHFSNYAVAW